MSIRLTHGPLSPGRAYAELADGGAGGVVLFAGRVRADAGARGRVRELYYEAHEDLARRALTELEADARRRFGLLRVVLWHRLGHLPVGTASVLVGCSTLHRAEAFRAGRYLIDRLKAEVPIWKTEARGRPARRRPARPARQRGR